MAKTNQDTAFMLGSHCRAICYKRPDWPFVADHRIFWTVQNFTTISTIATIDRGPQIVTDRERLQHIPTEPGVGLVQGWSQSPRFISTIRCDLSHFVRIWCDDHDWQVIVLIVEFFWTVQNYSTINKIATTDLKIW